MFGNKRFLSTLIVTLNGVTFTRTFLPTVTERPLEGEDETKEMRRDDRTFIVQPVTSTLVV